MASGNPSRLGAGARSTSSNETCSDERAPAGSSTQPGCNSRFQPVGTTTCCAASNTSARSEIRRTPGWMRQSVCSVPSGGLMVLGCWRTRIPERSTLRLRTAMVGPAGGTLFAPYGFCAGTTRLLRHRKSPEQELRKIRFAAVASGGCLPRSKFCRTSCFLVCYAKVCR